MRNKRQNVGRSNSRVIFFAASFAVLSTWLAPPPSTAQDDIERVSVGSGGVSPDAPSFNARTDADGSRVVFLSAASNLVANDANGKADIFVFDRNSGNFERVSLSFLGDDPNDNSFPAILSANGRYVAFGSAASNLVRGDFNTVPDIFLFDRETRSTVVMSLSQDGLAGGAVPDLPPAISADGRFVAFASQSDALAPNDDNEATDIFVFDRDNGTVEAMTYTSLGAPQSRTANGTSVGPAISDDGCLVAFYSDANNLVPQDTNSARDVFVRNRCSGDIERVSLASDGSQADGPSGVSSGAPGMSADGRFVVFFSNARNLDPADASGTTNVYIRDRIDGTTRLVSRAQNGDAANGPSQAPSVSADGRFVAFQSLASNLVDGDTNGRVDIFVVDLSDGEVRLVSGPAANGDSSTPQISSDGSRVVFQSSAQLTGDDTDTQVDVYSAGNPLSGKPVEPTATATSEETVGAETPTPTATAIETETGGTPTASPTAPLPSTTPTPIHSVEPTATAGGGGTPTAIRTPTSPTRTPTTPGGGIVHASSSGCGCRIDPTTGALIPDSPLPALALPALLWLARRLRQTRVRAH